MTNTDFFFGVCVCFYFLQLYSEIFKTQSNTVMLIVIDISYFNFFILIFTIFIKNVSNISQNF